MPTHERRFGALRVGRRENSRAPEAMLMPETPAQPQTPRGTAQSDEATAVLC